MGLLSGTFTANAQTVTISTEGVTDWASWGFIPEDCATPGMNSKSGAAIEISTITEIGGTSNMDCSTSGVTNPPHSLTWTGGTPEPTATSETAYVYTGHASSTGVGFEFTAPADTTTRKLRIYVGLYRNAQGKMHVTLSDASASAYNDTSFTGTVAVNTWGYYEITYAAASAGQTITVQWTLNTNPGQV